MVAAAAAGAADRRSSSASSVAPQKVHVAMTVEWPTVTCSFCLDMMGCLNHFTLRTNAMALLTRGTVAVCVSCGWEGSKGEECVAVVFLQHTCRGCRGDAPLHQLWVQASNAYANPITLHSSLHWFTKHLHRLDLELRAK